jgi:hypothetical protein
MRRITLVFVIAMVVLGATISQAVSLTLHDTGEGLSTGQSDSHWIVEKSDGSWMQAISGVDQNGNWVMPIAPATWISVIASGGVTSGLYKYSTTFMIDSGCDPTSAEISGYWWSDFVYNSNAIYLNGVKVSDFDGAWWPDNNSANAAFSIHSGFISGLNTLSFWISNDDGPSGILVQGLRGSVAPAPDAGSTLILLGSVTGLVGMFRRRLG